MREKTMKKGHLLLTLLAFVCLMGLGTIHANAATVKAKVDVKKFYGMAEQVLQEINKQRRNNGLSDLKMDVNLTEAAMNIALQAQGGSATVSNPEIYNDKYTVKGAFEMIWEEQKGNGWTDAEIDGMTGFVFCNRYGNVMNAQSVNRAIKRISSAYNATEEVEAKKEHREPVLLPNFSAHSLRHTFCTRLCERETNLKVIQSIMGHKDIQTTMDIYAEATEEKKQETFEHLAATMDVF